MVESGGDISSKQSNVLKEDDLLSGFFSPSLLTVTCKVGYADNHFEKENFLKKIYVAKRHIHDHNFTEQLHVSTNQFHLGPNSMASDSDPAELVEP